MVEAGNEEKAVVDPMDDSEKQPLPHASTELNWARVMIMLFSVRESMARCG
jgi:hypothetical protein